MMRAGEDYGVRVLIAYENRRVGSEFKPPALLRDKLVQRGFVERIAAPIETPHEVVANNAEDTDNDDGLFNSRGRRKPGRK